MIFTEKQIESISPNPAAYSAGKGLSSKHKWVSFKKNDRAIWGEIKGSGKNPYQVQIDLSAVAYKCSCPSRQFPCKHSIALLLLYANSENDFEKVTEEPEWVKNWLDKRQAKAEKPEKAVERTEEEQQKLDKAKEKTQVDRFDSVCEGVKELELWLKDIVRMGILELPAKPASEFEKTAKRMVDAKAPGLAGWVKAFTKLDYQDPDAWQGEALKIISKLFLLVSTFKNYDKLSPEWQITIKNLVGWNQSTKDLITDKEAMTIKDKWLAAGQEFEAIDDITIQRNWLVGCNTNQKALILNFGSAFSVIENSVLPGSVIEAEMAFFPSVLPNRAVIKIQRNVNNEINELPCFLNTWNEAYCYQTELLKVNPWANDHLLLIKDTRLFNDGKRWIVCDKEKSFMYLVEGFDYQKIMRWLVISGNRSQDISCILRNNKIMPLGIFQGKEYIIL